MNLLHAWHAMEKGKNVRKNKNSFSGNNSNIECSRVRILLCDISAESCCEALALLCQCSYQGTLTSLHFLFFSVTLNFAFQIVKSLNGGKISTKIVSGRNINRKVILILKFSAFQWLLHGQPQMYLVHWIPMDIRQILYLLKLNFLWLMMQRCWNTLCTTKTCNTFLLSVSSFFFSMYCIHKQFFNFLRNFFFY